MIKRILSFSLVLVMALGMFCFTTLAADTISITLNGKTIPTDTPPFIDPNNRTMVPVRFISEALGANVAWDANTRTVTVTKGSTVIKLQIDSRQITTNGVAATMDTAAIIVDGRTFVPVRYISEALGLTVGWDAGAKTVVLTTGGTVPATAFAAEVSVNIPKTQYEEGNIIDVTVSGVTKEMIDKQCWIAVYDVGGGTSNYYEWKNVTAVGISTIPLKLPMKVGSFEIRFVPQFSASGGHSAASQTLTIVRLGSTTVSLSLPQTQYAEGQRVNVTVSGVTQEMIDNSCWVAVYDAGGSTRDYYEIQDNKNWKYVTTVGTSIISLDLPMKLGSFEIRFVPQNAASGGHSAVSKMLTTTYYPPASNDIGDYSWTGEWDTNWGKMKLNQSGNSVTGDYEHDAGKIEGNIYGNVLIGKWSEYPTYSPDGDGEITDAGLFLFRMSEDGKLFTGGWCYKYAHPSTWHGWDGNSKRLTPVLPAY